MLCYQIAEVILITKDFIRKIRKGDIVLDIGANRGYYTILFSLIVGKRAYACIRTGA